MRKIIFLAIATLILGACSSPSPETTTIQETVIVEVPITVEVEIAQIVEVTREIEVTRQIEVTRIVEKPVTVTPTNTPIHTPTPSDTPTITPTPTPSSTPTLTPTPTATPNLGLTATADAYGTLAAPKGNGFYTVGVEILHGKWRSTGIGDGCYWRRLDANQDTIDNHYGNAGGTVNIKPTDYEVEFDDCGTWEYVENEVPVLQENATAPKEDGFYTVGIEIMSGIWESTGDGDSCYWRRMDANQNTIDNHYGNAGGTINIRPTDYEVGFDGCGIWEYVSP